MTRMLLEPVFLLVVAAFLLAGLVKGVIGMGLPTVAIGLMVIVMPPSRAAAILIVPSLVTNIWQMLAGRSLARLTRRLWPLLTGLVIGTLLGGYAFGGLARPWAVPALGATLVLYAALGLSAVRVAVPPALEGWLSFPMGLATGLVSAVTGVFVVPAVPYLQALELDRDDLIQALGLAFVTGTVALAIVLLRLGAFDNTVSWLSLAALGPALAGMAAGAWIRTRVSPPAFRTCFFLGMLALGCHFGLRAFV